MQHHLSLESFELLHSDPFAEPESIAGRTDWLRNIPAQPVHPALVHAGAMPHPYLDDNAITAHWIEHRSWWYRTEFDAGLLASSGAFIDFEGLDTVATIWLNGELLGHHANAFRPARFSAAGLRAEGNELLIRFDPPLAGLTAPEGAVVASRRIAEAFGVPPGDGHGIFGDVTVTRRRKAAVSWGWDFAPRIPSVGLTGSVTLVAKSSDRIADVVFRTVALSEDHLHATVRVDVSLELTGRLRSHQLSVTLETPSGAVHTELLELAAAQSSVWFELDEPNLWWTHDLGRPLMHRLQVELLDASAIADVRASNVGIRTVELTTDSDDSGAQFQFVLNGRPVFARGASVVPADLMKGSDPQKDSALVERAVGAGMNMLRIWGGGGYGSDLLYDRADELGVLVWQDFAFACMDYPSDDPDLSAEVELEARYQVRRLRNHPSLAVWVGNNEVHAMHQLAYGSLDPGDWGYRFFAELLPEIVTQISPTTAYWPGSPYGERDAAGVNGVADGDRHAWEIWHGLPLGAPIREEYATPGEAMHFRRYRWDTGRFISEFGLGSMPTGDTVSAWLAQEHRHLESEVYRSHVCDEPKDKAFALMEIETGLPRTVAEHIDYSQQVQAEGLKYGIEHYRSLQGHTSGTLVWQLNDAWPGFSWSLVDFDLRLKPAYHAVRRAFAPTIAAFREVEDGAVELWVVNSSRFHVTSALRIQTERVDGVELSRTNVPVDVAPWGIARVWSSRDGNSSAEARVFRCYDRTGAIPRNRFYATALKNLEFPQPKFDYEVTPVSPTVADLTISAMTPIHQLHIDLGSTSATADDDYIDLGASDTATVRLRGFESTGDAQALSLSASSPATTFRQSLQRSI